MKSLQNQCLNCKALITWLLVETREHDDNDDDIVRQVSSSGDVAHKLLNIAFLGTVRHLHCFTWLCSCLTLGWGWARRLVGWRKDSLLRWWGGIFIKYVTAYEEDLPAYLNFLSILFCGIWGNEDLKLPFKPCFIFWKCCRPFPFCIDWTLPLPGMIT